MVLCVCIVGGALAAQPAADDLLGTVDCIRAVLGCFVGVKDNPGPSGPNLQLPVCMQRVPGALPDLFGYNFCEGLASQPACSLRYAVRALPRLTHGMGPLP